MKKNSLTFRTFIGLSIFVVLFLLLLWFIQIEFLSLFYEKYQINKIETIVTKIKDNKDISASELETYAF